MKTLGLMTAYFDTNVYRHIAAVDEVRRVREWLTSRRLSLLASDLNLFETYAIADESTRRRELRIITSLAVAYPQKPMTWREALELRHAIGRFHPEWINRQPNTKSIRELLKGHRARWIEARKGAIPDPEQYAQFRNDFEVGVQQQRGAQRQNRQLRLKDATEFLLTNRSSPGHAGFPIDLDDPAQYWRVECLWSWFNAIVVGNPASRDYVDWLMPYLKPTAFRGARYGDFWLKQVTSADVPHNCLSGLVAFYQLEGKIQHGNAVDQSHAGYALISDVFVTCDRAFAEVLTQAGKAAPHFRAQIVLIDRAGASVADQLDALGSSQDPASEV